MTNVFTRLVGNVVDLVRTFTEVALADPLSAVLLTVGGLLTLFSVAVFGYLALGGLLALLASPR